MVSPVESCERRRAPCATVCGNRPSIRFRVRNQTLGIFIPLLRHAPPLYKALLLLAVFTIFAVINVSCAPLLSRLLVIMEFMSLGTLSLTITLSLYFTMDDALHPTTEVRAGGWNAVSPS